MEDHIEIKFKRKLAVLLVTVMLLSIFTGCNTAEPHVTDPSGSIGNGTHVGSDETGSTNGTTDTTTGTEGTTGTEDPTGTTGSDPAGDEPVSGTENTEPSNNPTTEPSNPANNPGTQPSECTHSWSNWTAKKAATCTEDGSEERISSKCGEKEQRAATATGHDWDEGKVTTTPTSCSDMGIKTYTCKTCGKTKTEQIKGNHTFGDWYYEEYTFQQTASSGKVYDRISHRKVRVCAACGYKETGGTPDHYCVKECSNHTVTKLEEATCSQKALYRSTCTICGWSTEYRSGAYDSHAWVDETRHLTDYTDYTNELDVTISTCTACGKKYIGYTKGEGFSDYNRYRNTVSVSQGTAYCGAYPVDDDEALLNHPTWQMVYRNFVYDSDGYVKQFTVYWHDTTGDRYSQVIHCGAGEMEAWFADYGVTVPDGYTGGYTLRVSGAQVVPYRIAWAG